MVVLIYFTIYNNPIQMSKTFSKSSFQSKLLNIGNISVINKAIELIVIITA